MTNSIRITIASFCLLFAGTSLWAGTAGTSGAVFLDIPVGAGPAAMGSAYSALATDAYAPVWNPAGLAFLENTQLAGQHLAYLESIHYEYLGFVHPLRPGDALGISAQYLGSGDISGTDVAGNPTGNYSDSFGAYSLSYGHAFGQRFALGLTGKVIHEKLSDVSASAYALDLGSLYRVNDKLDLAGTVTNAGSRLTLLNDADSLPLAFHLGAAYHPEKEWTWSGEMIAERGGLFSGRAGLDWTPLDILSLRAGYRTDTLKALSAIVGMSVGMGLHFWGQELDYAWVPYGALGDSHYISLAIRFGETGSRNQKLIQYRNIKQQRTVKDESNPETNAEPDAQQLMELLDQNQNGERLGQAPGSSTGRGKP